MKKTNYKCGLILITGLPNAGKSTLINCITKAKTSIVSSKVQTTQTDISGVINLKKTQLIFTDTPGIISTKKFNQKQISRSLLDKELTVDFNLFIYDLKTKINNRNIEIISNLTKKFKKNYLILNKIDLVEKSFLLEMAKKLNSYMFFSETFMISAKKNRGVDYLIQNLCDNVPNREWVYKNEIKIDKNINFQLSEITREKIFHLLNKEIPYSVKVITKIKNEKKIINIFQDIIVKKKSQKSILIGKNGSKIKMIGSRSRVDIEKLYKRKVFLNLIVKTEES